MNDKISPIGATIICIVLALACFVGWHRLRLEKEARKFFKEASGSHELERRVLKLEARLAELERIEIAERNRRLDDMLDSTEARIDSTLKETKALLDKMKEAE